MAWGAFAIALLLAFLLQKGVAAVVSVPAFDPFLILALLCGLLAPKYDARIAAWIVGLTQDLGSADALGIHAFTLGLTALLLTYFREVVNVHAWWVRALAVFVAACPGQLIYLLHLHYWTGHASGPLGGLLTQAAVTSLVATALTLLINALPWVMQRRRRFRSVRL